MACCTSVRILVKIFQNSSKEDVTCLRFSRTHLQKMQCITDLPELFYRNWIYSRSKSSTKLTCSRHPKDATHSRCIKNIKKHSSTEGETCLKSHRTLVQKKAQPVPDSTELCSHPPRQVLKDAFTPCIHIHISYTHLAKYQSVHVARHIVFYPSLPKHPSAIFPEMFMKKLNMQRKHPAYFFSNQNSEWNPAYMWPRQKEIQLDGQMDKQKDEKNAGRVSKCVQGWIR